MLREYILCYDALHSLGYKNPERLERLVTECDFAFVADVLRWAASFISETALPDSIETENDRITFMAAACRALTVGPLAPAAPVLYAAGKTAIPELAKILTVLVRASHRVRGGGEDVPPYAPPTPAVFETVRTTGTTLAASAGRLAGAIASAAHVPTTASYLGDANVAAARDDVDREIEEALANAARTEATAESLNEGLRAVEVQLQRRLGDVERARTRLAGLEAAAPAHAPEIQAAQARLTALTEAYALRHRNVVAVEALLRAAERKDEERRSQLIAEIRGTQISAADERTTGMIEGAWAGESIMSRETSAQGDGPWKQMSNADSAIMSAEIDGDNDDYEYYSEIETRPPRPPVPAAAPASAAEQTRATASARSAADVALDADLDAKIAALGDELDFDFDDDGLDDLNDF